ncbi:MAG: hypothetical protein WC315_04070 [Candidatus Omnitrophota bacterium]
MADDKKFEYILNQIEYGVVLVNSKSLKIIKINEAARKMFAFPEIDENFNIVQYIKNKFRVNVSDKGYFYFEGAAIDNCNRIFEVYTKFISNPDGEGAEVIVAIIRDVTVIKAQELKKWNLLGIMANKLKTEITEIRFSLKSVKESGAKQEQALNTVNDHCEKLDRLIKELLLFAESPV